MGDALGVVPEFRSGAQTEQDHRDSKLSLLCAVIWAVIIAATTAAYGAPVYPELTGRIVDNANLLNAADKAQIEAELQALETKSTDQVAVVTVPSLDGYAIEDYAIGLARKWAIGQKDKDNGALLIVAPNERKVRIEVGRRLEPTLTDTMAKLIIENAILSQFRRGDFSAGIRDGVRDIKAVLLGDAEEVKRRSIVKRTPQDDLTPFIHLIVFAAIIGLILWQMRQAAIAQREWEQKLTPEERRRYYEQRQRARNRSIVVVPGGSSNWGGSWSGGGSSGGGWSGGGGSFGGGGASGDW